MHEFDLEVLARYWTGYFDHQRKNPQDVVAELSGPGEPIFRAFDLWSEGRIPTAVLVNVLARIGHGLGTAAESLSVAFCQHAETGWQALEVFGSVTRWGEDYDSAKWWDARKRYEAEAQKRPGLWGAFFMPHRGSPTWDLKSLHQTVDGAHGEIQSRFDAVRVKARAEYPASRERNLATQERKGADRVKVMSEDEYVAFKIAHVFPGNFVIMPVLLKP